MGPALRRRRLPRRRRLAGAHGLRVDDRDRSLAVEDGEPAVVEAEAEVDAMAADIAALKAISAGGPASA